MSLSPLVSVFLNLNLCFEGKRRKWTLRRRRGKRERGDEATRRGGGSTRRIRAGNGKNNKDKYVRTYAQRPGETLKLTAANKD